MLYLVDSPKYGLQQVYLDRGDRKLIEKGIYLSKSGPFLYVRIKPHKKFLHRAIMNAPKGMVVDHIDRNPLNNRRSNLRVVSIQENLRNQKRPNNKTGYTGVAIAYGGKYSAQIKVNYKKIHLGIFNTIEEAYQARLKAEKKYYDIHTVSRQIQRSTSRL